MASTIPTNLRVPGTYFNIQSIGTGAISNQVALLVGQILTTGNATPNVPIIIGSVADAAAAFGTNSMLHLMFNRWFKNNLVTSVYALPLLDNPAGVASINTVTLTGPATQSGTINLYIAGDLVQTAVNTGDTATVMATNVATSINTTSLLPVTATASAGVVTITSNHAGATGGDVDVRVNYKGKIGGEVLPAGVGVTIAQTTAGATDPITDTALANLSAQTFDFIDYPYPQSTQMTSIESFLSDVSGTWSWQEKKFGHAWSAYKGTLAQLTTYGVTNNNQHVTVFGINDSPRSIYDIATAVVAVAAQSLQANPAVPLQDLQVDIMAPQIQNQFTIAENNTLLFDGISTFNYDAAGNVYIERAITTYQTNAEGDIDISYLDVETMYTLAYVIKYIDDDLSNKFSRYILLADGSQIKQGSNATTPSLVCGEAINDYMYLSTLNLVQNPTAFAQAAKGTMGTVPGTVNLYLPIVVADQLRIINSTFAFSK